MNQNCDAMQQHSSIPGQGGEEEDDDEDNYWDDDCFEGTPLEEYSTPLDYDSGDDEYHFFTSTLLSKLSSSIPHSFNKYILRIKNRLCYLVRIVASVCFQVQIRTFIFCLQDLLNIYISNNMSVLICLIPYSSTQCKIKC